MQQQPDDTVIERFLHELHINEEGISEGIKKQVLSNQYFKLLVYKQLINKLSKDFKSEDAVKILSECRAFASLLLVSEKTIEIKTTRL